MYCTFFHSPVCDGLCHWSGRRGELVVRTLGLQLCSEEIAYGQGGLSFKRVLESPDRYLREMGHPHLLVIDLGSNDLTCVYSTVAEVADEALRFLALLDNDVHPKMFVLLSVIQRTSVSDRGGMTVSTFNHRVKAFNSRIAAWVRQFSQCADVCAISPKFSALHQWWWVSHDRHITPLTHGTLRLPNDDDDDDDFLMVFLICKINFFLPTKK